MANKYPPYMNAYGKIRPIFDSISKAAVPDKFTYDLLKTVLGFKSSSDRAVISLLKRLGLLTQDGLPTESYREYRNRIKGPRILAEAIRAAYNDIFVANEYAHKLSREEVEEIIHTKTGAKKGSITVSAIAGSFDELCKLADFEKTNIVELKEDEELENEKDEEEIEDKSKERATPQKRDFAVSYTINLNLPATSDVKVFNAIFKSLKEHILYD